MKPKKQPDRVHVEPEPSALTNRLEIEPDLWKRRGIEDVFFQRENMVNFWTVMGGIAAAALLTQFGALEENLFTPRWYLALFFTASILTIVNSWVQSAWGSLVLCWPITVPGTLIYFLGLFSLCVQSLLVTRPVGWLAASAAVILFAILNQIYFSRSGAWEVFSAETIRRFQTSIRTYIFFFLLSLLGVAQLIWFPSNLAEMIWGLIVLAVSILALVMQHKGMQLEKTELGIP